MGILSPVSCPLSVLDVPADINKYIEEAETNPSEITSLRSLIEHMKQDPREKYAEYGAVNFEKADKTDVSDKEISELFKLRQSKGLEIHKMLDDHSCDAMIVPAHCHNPNDLAQCPVLCVPMGFYSTERAIEHSDGGLVSKGPNIPSASYQSFTLRLKLTLTQGLDCCSSAENGTSTK